MIYKKTSTGMPAASYIAGRIAERLRTGQQVLWLLAGGSAIPVAVAAAAQLQDEQLGGLTITLTDERYGPPGHAASNWQQLLDAGLALPAAKLHPVLSGAPLADTADAFNTFLTEMLQEADYRIGLFGMGADGHASGLLPHCSALSSTAMAAHYQGPDYTRITTTPAAIAQLDTAVLYAMGEAKHEALSNLGNKLQLERQPAQVLKRVPEFVIFNDYKGE